MTRIPGLLFSYTAKGRVNYVTTGWHMWRYLANRSDPAAWSRPTIREAFRHEQPDLVLSDFEPELLYQARLLGVPAVTVDHQSFLVSYDLSQLPWHLRLHAWSMGRAVKFFDSGVHHITSSFYFPPLRADAQNFTQVGVMISETIRHAQPEDAGHITVYLRRNLEPNVRSALNECGRPVHIFTATDKAFQEDNLYFHPIHPDKFIESLVRCSILVTTGGNQLPGEALYLGKPVLVMPERGNHEQEINAYFLTDCGGGISIPMPQLDGARLGEFLADASRYRLDADLRRQMDGLPTVLDRLEKILAELGVTASPEEGSDAALA